MAKKYERLGVMIDMSRNAVMNLKALKEYLVLKEQFFLLHLVVELILKVFLHSDKLMKNHIHHIFEQPQKWT